MGALGLDGLFRLAQVLSSKLSSKTKKILLQIGDVNGEGQVEQDDVSLWQQPGLASRPAKAEPGKDAAQVFVVRAGAEDYAIAFQDNRDLAIYGTLAEGETCIYATGDTGDAQARALFKKDGSITLYTRQGNTSSGTGMMIQLDAMNGAIRLVSPHGHGIIIDEDGIKMFAGNDAGAITIGADGNIRSIATQQNQTDGGTVVLGSTVVPVINAALTGPTGIAGVASTKVLISTA